jgi:hypothetical protein
VVIARSLARVRSLLALDFAVLTHRFSTPRAHRSAETTLSPLAPRRATD